MKYIEKAVLVILAISLILFGGAIVKDYILSDSSKPTITSTQDEISVPCDYTYEQMTAGLSAHDDKDGDLTDHILVGHMSRFIEPGVCDITYVVFDSSQHSASLTRRVHFSDYESPQVRSSSALVFALGEGNHQQLLSRLSVYDMIEGELKDHVSSTSSNVSYSTEGRYYITVEASNNYGDSSSVRLPVHIVNSSDIRQTIRLNQYIVYVNQGDDFSASDLISDEQSGSLTKSQVSVASSSVDTSKAGVYEVRYTAGDSVTWAVVVVRGE